MVNFSDIIKPLEERYFLQFLESLRRAAVGAAGA